MENESACKGTEIMGEQRIWVIGGANIDIIGHASHQLKDYDSNMGDIKKSFGGVGRNIAQACAELGESVSLVTCFGADDYGNLIKENCVNLGIDTSFSITSKKHPTSTYLAILDEKRDMRIAMNDMRILEEIDEHVLKTALDEMTLDDYLVLDSNLEPSLIEYITENTPAKIASDPVSAAKIPRLKSVLNRISIFKPNAIESKELTGIEIVDDETARDSLDWFIDRGVEEIIITLGERGILFGNKDEKLWITHKTVKMDSANGGGDAMFGAYLSRKIKREDSDSAIRFAIAAAVLKVSGESELNNNSETQTLSNAGNDSTRDRNRRALEREKRIIETINTLDIKERKL
ncbi:MAG: carbohydrate kinase family protein [Firmicutes bacterium]|nr:carbohydrate kinase family protein [Bacillota bacterium]